MIFNGNRKGLASSLVAIVLVLFLFAFTTVLAHTIWNPFNDAIQNLDSSIADNQTKERIDDLGSKIAWGDKLFTIFLVVLLIAYLITSFTLPVENAWFMLLFMFFLVLITFLAMVLSNSWTYMLSDPVFSSVAGDVPITDYVLRNFPVFIFFIGIIGAVIFYSRSREDSPSIGGGFDGGGQEF